VGEERALLCEGKSVTIRVYYQVLLHHSRAIYIGRRLLAAVTLETDVDILDKSDDSRSIFMQFKMVDILFTTLSHHCWQKTCSFLIICLFLLTILSNKSKLVVL